LQTRFKTSRNTENKNGLAIKYTKTGVEASELQIEEFVFSAGGGFLFGAAAGFAIKKVMKIAAVVVGLFVAGLAYLSYKGWVEVKLVEMENATKTMLTNVAGQAIHALNNTTSQFAAHPTALEPSGLPVAAAFGFMPGLLIGFRRG
jgi:uncharacterized membrane protein (Fun14 family)